MLPDLGPRMFPSSQNPKETGVDIEYVKAQGRSGSIFLEMGRGRRPLAAGQQGNGRQRSNGTAEWTIINY